LSSQSVSRPQTNVGAVVYADTDVGCGELGLESPEDLGHTRGVLHCNEDDLHGRHSGRQAQPGVVPWAMMSLRRPCGLSCPTK
jgi:hypothetical protein